MMLDVEQFMSWNYYKDVKLYFNVCSYTQDSLSSEADGNSEWMGRINALKKIVKDQGKSFHSKIDQLLRSKDEKVDELIKNQNKLIEMQEKQQEVLNQFIQS